MSYGEEMLQEAMAEEYGESLAYQAGIRNAIENEIDRPYILNHKTKEGSEIPFNKLTNKHLDNIIKFLRNKDNGYGFDNGYRLTVYELERLKRTDKFRYNRVLITQEMYHQDF